MHYNQGNDWAVGIARSRLIPFLRITLAICLPMTALAAEDANAHRAADTFIAGCMQHAGSAASLRTWIATQSMTQAPPDVSDHFVPRGTGQVYGIRVGSGVLLVVSQADGGCTLVVQSIDGPTVRQTFESLITGANASLRVVRDEDSKPDATLHHRGYEIENADQTRRWRVVISTAKLAAAQIQAMLTSYPLPLD